MILLPVEGLSSLTWTVTIEKMYYSRYIKIVNNMSPSLNTLHCILELFILTNIIVLAKSQDFLTATERRILEGLTGTKDGQVHLFEQAESAALPNVRDPNSHVVHLGDQDNQSQSLYPVPLVHRANHLSDLSGQLDNQEPISVVTRQSAAYVDLPEQHGNESPHPVFHKQSGPRKDLPGQHGKELPHPVVYRQSGSHIDLPGQHGKGLPGQHGNISFHPMVLRQSASQVDLPGQHGIESPHPIVHRQSGSSRDLPGQHGNEFSHPVVHRQSGSHVDLLGHLGNKSLISGVHRNSHQVQSFGQHGSLSLNPGTHSQSRFIDPVSRTPVIISSQNNNIGSFQHEHSESVTGYNTLNLDSVIGTRNLFAPRAIPQPPARRPFDFRMPRPTYTQFSRHRDPGVSFRGPFGPLPFVHSPETRRIPEQIRRRMRRRMIMGGLPPPFPPLQPPPPRPARIGLGGILAGMIGSLFGSLFRQ